MGNEYSLLNLLKNAELIVLGNVVQCWSILVFEAVKCMRKISQTNEINQETYNEMSSINVADLLQRKFKFLRI